MSKMYVVALALSAIGGAAMVIDNTALHASREIAMNAYHGSTPVNEGAPRRSDNEVISVRYSVSGEAREHDASWSLIPNWTTSSDFHVISIRAYAPDTFGERLLRKEHLDTHNQMIMANAEPPKNSRQPLYT